jgi:hypothetical protein
LIRFGLADACLGASVNAVVVKGKCACRMG